MIKNIEDLVKSFSNNGHLRCYNLFPEYFGDIDAMTAYLPTLKKMGINTVWINPVQLAGNKSMSKTDVVTGFPQEVTKSIYAMMDPEMIDPRFSVVKRDKDGDMVLSINQITAILNEAQFTFPDSKVNHIDTFVADLKAQRKIYEQNKVNPKAEPLKENYEALMALQKRCIRFLDTRALQAFTHKAKALGIAPIFDLVTNHVAKDAPITQKHPEWFCDDNTYLDATGFKYAELLDFSHMRNEDLDAIIAKDWNRLSPMKDAIHSNLLTENQIQIINGSVKISDEEKSQLQTKVKFNRSLQERKKIESMIPDIVKEFWAPFISQYIDLGFSGARVDCVRKVPAQLRTQLYKLLKDGVKKRDGENAPVVILEEALFSDLSPRQFRDVVQGAGGTHITASVFNSERQWDGSLKYNHSEEEYFKKQMAEQGVINFTGNHDHYACAMKVAHIIAKERLENDTSANALFKTAYPTGATAAQIRESQFLHSYVQDILNELKDPNKNSDLCQRFGKMYRDFLLSQMFQGSSGYYMLSGDEAGSFKQPTVFVRENGQPLYPQTSYAFFTNEKDPLYPHAQAVLKEMAAELSTKSSDRVVKTIFNPPAPVVAPAPVIALPKAKAPGKKEKVLSPAEQQKIIEKEESIRKAREAAKLKLEEKQKKEREAFLSLPPLEQEAIKEKMALAEKRAEEEAKDKAIKAEELRIANEKAEREKASIAQALLTSNFGVTHKNRLLSAAKAQIMNEVNAKVSKTWTDFFEKLAARYKNIKHPSLKITTALAQKNYARVERLHKQTTPQGWESPTVLSKFVNPTFFAEINGVFDKLPRSNNGFWCEIFKRQNEDILVIMRKNGQGFDSPTDLIIVNLNPFKQHDIDRNELHKMALWVQKRFFGDEPKYNDPHWHKSYGTIMGNTDFKQKPAKLYFVGQLTVNQDIKDYNIEIDGKKEKFEIVVEPKPIKIEPFMEPTPDKFFSEDSLMEKLPSLTTRFNALSLSNSVDKTNTPAQKTHKNPRSLLAQSC